MHTAADGGKEQAPELDSVFSREDVSMDLTMCGLLVEKAEQMARLYATHRDWTTVEDQWFNERIDERSTKGSSRKIYRVLSSRFKTVDYSLPAIAQLPSVFDQCDTHRDKAQVLYFYLIEDDPLVKYTVHEYPSPEAANPEELTENAWLTAKPKLTGLKNGKGSERHITLREDVCDAVDEYLKYNWTPTTEDSGRRPLLVTERGSGRIAKSTIRKYIYELTRPCKTIDKCPAGINPADCPAVGDGKTVTSCKENASPKALRTGSSLTCAIKASTLRMSAERLTPLYRS